jgi:hypothetical protein
MKKFVLTVVLLTALNEPALAAHSIGIFEDAAATSCEISDPGGPSTKLIYIVHTNELVVPVGGSVWKLEWDAGMTMTWIGDTTPYFHVGNAKDGISIAYSPCQGGTFVIDTVSMTSAGTSTPCSRFRLVAHPTQGLAILRCGSYDPMSFVPGEGIVNPNVSCACTVAVEPTTWGSVKALYR